MITISNLGSPKTDMAVANQFNIETENGSYFQSYSTVIAFRDTSGRVTIAPQWDETATTLKYFRQWMGTSKPLPQIREDLISDGVKVVFKLTIK